MGRGSDGEGGGRRALTDAAGVVVVLHGLHVGLQLLPLVPGVHPLVFHDLLGRSQGRGHRHDQSNIDQTRETLCAAGLNGGCRQHRIATYEKTDILCSVKAFVI